MTVEHVNLRPLTTELTCYHIHFQFTGNFAGEIGGKYIFPFMLPSLSCPTHSDFVAVGRSGLIFFGLSLILEYAALSSLFVAFMVRDANGDKTVPFHQPYHILMPFHVHRLLYFR